MLVHLSSLFFTVVGAWFALTRRVDAAELADLRRAYRRLVDAGEPLLICGPHAARADGWTLLWLLARPFEYLVRPARRPWIVADRDSRFAGPLDGLWHRIGKIVSSRQRAGLAANREALSEVEAKLAGGEPVLVFPTGDEESEDSYSYLVGRSLRRLPETRVLQIAFRDGRLRRRVSSFSTEQEGLRGVRDLAAQVNRSLGELDAGE